MRESSVRIDPDHGMNTSSNRSTGSITPPSHSAAHRDAQPRIGRVDRHLWLALLLAVPAMLTLLSPDYFMKAHDARHSIFFLVEFDQSIREGALWPVWGPDHSVGFGYPTFLVYAPLAYYVGEVFHLLGMGFAIAIKATWAIGFLAGATGVYRLARRWFRPEIAMVASLAFTYAPYHLSQIYVRAALAEFMAMAWLPWTALALLLLWEDPSPRRAAFAALSLAALMLFHTVSTLTFVPLLAGLLVVLFMQDLGRGRPLGRGLLSQIRAPSTRWTLLALTLTGLLASIFFVPLLLDRAGVAQWQWVNETYSYRLHFVYPGQFLDPTWGYGYSVEGPGDGMSFQLGIVTFILATLGAAAAWGKRAGHSMPRALAAYFVVATAIAIFMMTPLSVRLWDVLPLIAMVQFPWRLLSVTVFTGALLAASGVDWLSSRSSTISAAVPSPYIYVIGLVLVLGSLPYIRPELVPLRPVDESPLAVLDFEMTYPNMRGMTSFSERLPADEDSPLIAQYLAGEPLKKAVIASGTGEILEQDSGALFARARVRADTAVTLRFYTYYFAGWRAAIDGSPVQIRPDGPNGLIVLDAPPGEHEVTVFFGSTPPRMAGALLSGLGLVGVLLLLALEWRRRNPMRGHGNLR